MLSKKMNKALNEQVAMEAQAAAYYLSMASWCDQRGLDGSAAFFYRQSEEEREHMLKIFRYMNEADGKAEAPAVTKPPANFDNFTSLFETALSHEKKVTDSIHKIMKLANTENDYRTISLLQWFVDEQLEEETQMQTILDKLKLIGDNGVGLYMIDSDLGQRAAAGEEEEA